MIDLGTAGTGGIGALRRKSSGAEGSLPVRITEKEKIKIIPFLRNEPTYSSKQA